MTSAYEMPPENVVPDGLTSPRSSISGTSGSQRKERGAIAAQACDTCRNRKQRCSEDRPKCSTCQKFNLECHYREPQPTKKDKTLVEILDRIKSLEEKVDGLSLHGTFSAPMFSTIAANAGIAPGLAAGVANVVGPVALGPDPPGTLALPIFPTALQPHGGTTSSPASGPGSSYSYVSAVHQMLGWSVVKQMLESVGARMPNINSSMIEHEGAAIVLGLNDPFARLPSEPAGPLTLSLNNATAALPAGVGAPFGGVPLTRGSMQILSKAYFDTFNLLYPILDRATFAAEVLSAVYDDGFNDNIHTTLAFLVFGLGEVAIAGNKGVPLQVYNARPSGLKGGSTVQPPGLALFNEARRRMGFNLSECSVENVQIFALAGIYYGSCSQHMEFWRMSAMASLACQALITGKPSELASPRADVIRRCFWYCSIMENYFALELGLPLSGLESLEDVVGLPSFAGSYSQDDYLGNQASHFQDHFASQMLLRRLSAEAHALLGNDPTSFPATIKQLNLQLDRWKTLLPAHLGWRETRPAEFPHPPPPLPLPQPAITATSLPAYGGTAFFPEASMAPIPPSQSPFGYMFTTDLDAAPVSYPYNMDVQVAVLRSRYYYTKYCLHRPFIFKALSHPEQLTHEDANGVSECLRACLKWPISMSPTCAHKRLVPCLFFWTQNLLGILVVLHLSQQVPILLKIRTTMCGESFELEAGETVGLYMDWIRDLKSVDKAAQWAWEVVMAVYRLDE